MSKSNAQKERLQKRFRSALVNTSTPSGVGNNNIRKNLCIFANTFWVCQKRVHAIPAVTLADIVQVEASHDISVVHEVPCHICVKAAVRVCEYQGLPALYRLESVVLCKGIGLAAA